MQTPTCQILKPDDPAWSAFVEQHPSATIFHHPRWIGLLARCYGYRPFIAAVVDDHGQICAGLPMVEVNSRLTGRRWVSLPYSDHCAPLYLDSAGLIQLTDSLLELARARGIGRLQVRSTLPERREIEPQIDFVLHGLPLDPTPEQTLKRFGHSHRQNVRTAEKRGVRVDVGTDLAAMRAFYDLQVQTRQRHGVPVQPWRYFGMLWDDLIAVGLGFVLLAYQDDQCIAGGVYLHWQQTLVAKYAASREDSLNLRPNDLLFWTAIRWGCEHGCQLLDFGRTEYGDQGLRQFKCRWGAEERDLVYSNVGQPASMSEDGRLHELMHAVIRRSPPWVCRAVGQLFYGHFE